MEADHDDDDDDDGGVRRGGIGGGARGVLAQGAAKRGSFSSN
jgi:hypothetical protein